MKRILIRLALLAVAATGSVACLDDMDVKQKSKITTPDMWLDESDARCAPYSRPH